MKIGRKYKAVVAGEVRSIHVRAFVDNQVVYKWWRRSKQRWEYGIEEERFILDDPELIKAINKNKRDRVTV